MTDKKVTGSYQNNLKKHVKYVVGYFIIVVIYFLNI